MFLPNQEIIGNATYSEMIEAANFLATDREKRIIAEEEIKQNLLGHTIGIDQFGIIHIMSPLDTQD